MEKPEMIQTDLRISQNTQQELERASRKMRICVGSFAKWMLFRGCLAYYNNRKEFWASIKTFIYTDKKPESAKQEEEKRREEEERIQKELAERERKAGLPESEPAEKRIQVRGYNTLHTRIGRSMKDRIWDISRDSANPGNHYHMTELSNRIIRTEYQKFCHEREEAGLTEKVGSNKVKKITLTISEEQYRDLEDIYKITGIKPKDLIPLMLCEYLMILNEMRIR